MVVCNKMVIRSCCKQTDPPVIHGIHTRGTAPDRRDQRPRHGPAVGRQTMCTEDDSELCNMARVLAGYLQGIGLVIGCGIAFLEYGRGMRIFWHQCSQFLWFLRVEFDDNSYLVASYLCLQWLHQKQCGCTY